jgi:hypothetical protein
MLGGQHPMAKNMDYGCDTFSEHVGKEIKDATGK